MNASLQRIVDKIISAPRMNPDEIVDGSLLLQLELVQSGARYSEDDLFEALKMLGLPPEEQASWFERYASWV